MKTPQQRAAKRAKRENRLTKLDTWFCAGCGVRHPNGQRCPTPRLFAKGFNRVVERPKD